MNPIVTKPCEAGALVSGRPAAKIVSEAGRARQNARGKKPREQWRIVVVGNHPGSLSWEECLQNPHVLEAKRAMPEEATGGAVKRGAAWLRGGCAVGAVAASSPWSTAVPTAVSHAMAVAGAGWSGARRRV